MGAIKRINVVFIYVKDMNAMCEFYEKVLKLGEPTVNTDLWVEYELPGTHLALQKGDERILREHNANTNTIKLSFEVENLEVFHKELIEKGVEITIEPRTDFYTILTEFKDCEGNLIRMVQYR
jgi:predicted enzyme related to lactoylglutathione lyase